MGFMAGFGPAFADAFNSGNERRAKQKDDMFKLTYSEFLNRREKYEEQKKNDEKLVRSAKTYASDLAGNEEAWPKIYEWMSAGMGEDSIREMIAGGEFETRPTAAVDAKVGSEMVDAGLDQPAAPSTPAGPVAPPAPETAGSPQFNPSGQGGFMDKIFPGMSAKRDERRVGESMDRISQITGNSREEIDSVMKGGGSKVVPDSTGIVYKRKPAPVEPDKINAPEEVWIEQAHAQREYDSNPSASNEVRLQKANDRMKALKSLESFKEEQRARADAAKDGKPYGYFSVKLFDEEGNFTGTKQVREANGGYETEDGKMLPRSQVKLWAEDEQEEYSKVAKATAAIGKDHLQRADGVKSLLYLGKDMADIVAASGGNVLAQRTAGLSGLAMDWAQELTTVKNILTDDNIDNDKNAPAKIADIDLKITAMLGKGVSDLATQRALLDAKATIFAYKLGMAMGQEGRALAETERAVFQKLADSGSSPEKFNQNIANLIADQVRGFDSVSSDLNQYNIEMEAFQQRFDWDEPPFQTVPTFPDLMKKEPTLGQAYDYFKPYMNTAAGAAEQQQNLPTFSSPSDPAFQALPSGSKFIDPKGNIRTKK